ncbi:MAG: MFS transporter [Desulfocucumaceae bacterium]
MSDASDAQPGSRALKLFIFFYFSTIGIFLPFLPLLLKNNGLSNWQVGVLFSIGPLVVVTMQPAWGFVSDRLKTVKKLVVFQLVVTAFLSLLVFRLRSFELLFPALLLFNIFSYPIIPLTDSLTLSSVKSQGGHYGGFRLWGSLGFGLSAAIFGMVFRVYGLHLFPACYFLLLLFCIAVSLFMVDAEYIGRRAGLTDMKALVSSRKVMVFLFLTALLSSSNRANDAFLGVYLMEIGGSAQTVGYAWMVAALSEVPVMAAGGVLLTRYSELRLLAVAAAFFTARWALFAVVTDPGLIVLIQLTHSLSFGLFFICSVSYLSKLVPDRLRSSGQGLLSCFLGGLAGIAGSILGGMVMTGMGPRTLYTACTLVALASFCFYLYLAGRESRDKEISLTG